VTETLCKRMMNLSRHTDLLCEFEASLLKKRLQIGEMSNLDWMIGLVMHAICADSLYFLYLLLLSISKILASSQPTLRPSSFACLANFDFSRRRLCLRSRSRDHVGFPWSHAHFLTFDKYVKVHMF
jgi:hypothetical protein